MTSQGLDCGVLPLDIIQALNSEINRLSGSLPDWSFQPQQAGFYPQQPAFGPQMYRQAYQAPLVNQTYPHSESGPQTGSSIRSFEQRYPVEARTMPASVGETPHHDFAAAMYNYGRPDTVIEAIERLKAVEQAQLESPRSPPY